MGQREIPLDQRLAQIVQQVVDVLDSNAESHQFRRYGDGGPGSAGVRHAVWMLNQAFHPAQAFRQREEFGP